MKSKYLYFIFVLLCLVGCSGLPYSFAENESKTATIIFEKRTPIYGPSSDINLLEFDGIALTKKTKNIVFPAGRSLKLKVHVHEYKYDREILFECPALEAGKTYECGFYGVYKGAGHIMIRQRGTLGVKPLLDYEYTE